MLRILMAAHDLGGAQMYAPVCQELLAEGHNLLFFGAGPALGFWTNQGFDVASCDPSGADAQKLIHEHQPDLVATGTSYKSDLERKLWKAATQENIPSFAAIDATMNLERRLRLVDGSELIYPDRAAVVTAQCQVDMVRTGMDNHRITVVGQPHLQQLVTRLGELRQSHQTGSPAILTFYSEPIFQDEPGPLSPGYDQFTVFAAIIAALKGMKNIRLVVRIHPREKSTDWELTLGDSETAGLDILLDTRTHDAAIATTDAAIGMTSMALVESVLLGIPVLALQPARTRNDNPLLDHLTGEPAVINPAEVSPAIQRLVDRIGHAEPLTAELANLTHRACTRLQQSMTEIGSNAGIP